MMWIIYLIEVLDTFKIIVIIATIILLAIFFVVKYINLIEGENYSCKSYFIAGLCTLFFSVVLPSKETSITMAAVYVGEKVVTSDTVTNLTKDSIDYLQTWINTEKEKLEHSKSEK